jgi:hypothetical protein
VNTASWRAPIRVARGHCTLDHGGALDVAGRQRDPCGGGATSTCVGEKVRTAGVRERPADGTRSRTVGLTTGIAVG